MGDTVRTPINDKDPLPRRDTVIVDVTSDERDDTAKGARDAVHAPPDEHAVLQSQPVRVCGKSDRK